MGQSITFISIRGGYFIYADMSVIIYQILDPYHTICDINITHKDSLKESQDKNCYDLSI